MIHSSPNNLNQHSRTTVRLASAYRCDMDPLFVSATLVMLALLYVWWTGALLPANYPPGPRGFPLVGCLPLAARKRTRLFLEEMSLGRGHVFHIPLGSHNVVVLNSREALKEAFVSQSETFSGRPSLFVMDCITKREDLTWSDGEVWKERRQLVLHCLHAAGSGKTPFENIILGQIARVLDNLHVHGDGKVDMNHLALSIIGSNMLELLAGETYDGDEEELRAFNSNFEKLMDHYYKCVEINFLPLLRHLPGSSFAALNEGMENMHRSFVANIEARIRTNQIGTGRNVIDTYLTKWNEKTGSQLQADRQQIRHLAGMLADLYVGGVDTSLSTSKWGLLYIATWPKIQEKMHEEIDNVIGQGRLPCYLDRTLMPYTEAVLLEIHRYAIIAPTLVPHCNIRKAKILGYTLPAGTVVVTNMYAINFDPEFWDDPEIFRPERFIDESGKVHKRECLYPFSLGARKCVGETAAKMQLFLFVVCILQRYRLLIPTGERPPPLETASIFNSAPKDYSLIFERRT